MIQISLADISNIFFSGELKQFEENLSWQENYPHIGSEYSAKVYHNCVM
jgi:hypothetical protein